MAGKQINRKITVDGRKTLRILRIHKMLGLIPDFGGMFTGRFMGYKTYTTDSYGCYLTFHFCEDRRIGKVIDNVRNNKQ